MRHKIMLGLSLFLMADSLFGLSSFHPDAQTPPALFKVGLVIAIATGVRAVQQMCRPDR